MNWFDLAYVGPPWAAGFGWRAGALYQFRSLPSDIPGGLISTIGVCVYARPVRIVEVESDGTDVFS